MALQAQICAKTELKEKLFDLRKRALSQPEFKRPSLPEDYAPLRKRFKSIEVPRPKSVKILCVTIKHDSSDDKDENKGDSYFELIDETTACKKISMEDRGDAFVLTFTPGGQLAVLTFDNHVLPDELCVTK